MEVIVDRMMEETDTATDTRAANRTERSGTQRVVYLHRIDTPLGSMLCGATEEALCLLEFADRRMLRTQLARVQKRLDAELIDGATQLSEDVERQLAEYFTGERRRFSIPLVTCGTPFQEKVWRELQTIPPGQTRSYGEQAKRVGSAGSVRAVARANGDNRIAIIIPCHRVIGADGKLTGYGGGVWRKQRLLELERGQGRLL